MKYCFLILAMLCLAKVFTQSKPFKISGTLVSLADSTALEAATIHLEHAKDSTLVTYAISDQKGQFVLEGKTRDSVLNLYVSYVGYQTHFQSLKIGQKLINLNTISLKTDLNALEEVLVKVTPPVSVKKDTLKFNANSFKTKKNANVEELLKKLPGIEVSKEGKITINGKDVDNILVNGKPFFSNDPTITTRFLKKDLIEHVQITDTKTESEAFAGDEGKKEKKTINLVIKEDNNNGSFGQLMGGIGTHERYELAGMLNMFNNDRRISILGGGNNINSPGFSFGRGARGGEGITISQNYGTNYIDKLKKKHDISANYFYSSSSTENENTVQRDNILPDSRFTTNSGSNSYNENDNHNARLTFNIKVDSTLLINIYPTFNFSKNKTETMRQDTSRNSDQVLTNTSNLSSFGETTTNNFNNYLDITKRFGKKGAYLRFNISNKYNSTTSENFLNSETHIFGENPLSIIRDQLTTGDQEQKGFYTNTSLRWPLKANTLFLDFKFDFKKDIRDNIKSTYAFDDATQNYTRFDKDQSTDFMYKDRRSTPSLRLTYKEEKWSVSSEMGYVFRTLENSDFLRPELNLTRNFETMELRSNFQYQLNPKSYIYANYGLSNLPPGLNQLQAFQDVSNPLNTITGNPNLKPANTHSFYLGHNTHHFQKRRGFYNYVFASLNNNQVVTKTTVDANLVRNTTYENVNGAYNVSVNSGYNKTVKVDSLRTVKFNVGLAASLNRTVNFNNDIKYNSNNTALTPNASISFSWDDVLIVVPNYRLSFNTTKFDIDDFKDQEFLNHAAGLQLTTLVPKRLEWHHDISFTYNPNVAEGFQKSAWLWNSTLAYSMLKDQGVLSLRIYDLLNQNTNARRVATQNYIQDSQSLILRQYLMLSFSWKFNRF